MSWLKTLFRGKPRYRHEPVCNACGVKYHDQPISLEDHSAPRFVEMLRCGECGTSLCEKHGKDSCPSCGSYLTRRFRAYRD